MEKKIILWRVLVPIPSDRVDGLKGKWVKSLYSSRCCKLKTAFETDGHFPSTDGWEGLKSEQVRRPAGIADKSWLSG